MFKSDLNQCSIKADVVSLNEIARVPASQAQLLEPHWITAAPNQT